MNQAYLEIVDFFAGNNPEAVANYRPSAAAQQRVSDLLARNQDGVLTEDEKAELDHFMELEHFIRMAKGRARLKLADGR